MSKNVDERVVEMKFDNKQFESGVQTSLNTIDKLKNSLNMDGAAKGLENVSAAAGKCNMSGLGRAIETVHAKFSAFEVMAVTALANITNSAVNAGKRIVQSLTVEPVSQGFGEYELKMGSVQTIMASTGESLETVNRYLQELNTYADKTIYSFSDMTANIGKFTNAGVKLEDAVKAIQGISNEAAVSGANANEASRAMYNFAQALSAGYVKLIDWKSIENANMATVEFKNNLIQTAVELGTLVEEDGMYISTTTDANGKVSAAFDATRNFNDSLSAQWMTTDVLVKALGDYADETTDIGKKAFAAAQDVKTFTQLMDTLKEAAGSGWATTWETVFGDFEEAKKLWTGVSTVVGGFIDAQSDARNSLLQEWKDLGGRTKLIEAFQNAFKSLLSILRPVREAFREIFPKITADRLYSITESLADFTARLKLSDKASANLKSTFKGLFAALDIVRQAFSAVFRVIRPLFGGLDDLGGGILGVTGKIGNWLVRLDNAVKKSDIFYKALQKIVDFIKSIPGKIDSVFQSITGSSIGDVLDKIREKIGDFLDKLKEIFSGFGEIDTNGIDVLAEKVFAAFKPLTTLFDGVKKIFGGVWNFLKKAASALAPVGKAVGQALGNIGKSLGQAFKTGNFDKILNLINGGVLISIGVGIKKFIDSLKGVSENASGFLNSLTGILNGAKGSLNSLTGILNGVKGSLESWQKDIKSKALLKIAAAMAILTASLVVLSMINPGKLYNAIRSITVLFTELVAAMAVMGKTNKLSFGSSSGMIAMASAILILSAALKKISGLDSEDIVSGLAGIAGLAAILIVVSKALSKGGKGFASGTLGLITFALAIRMLVKPVSDLADLDTDSLIKGLAGVGALLAELVLFLKMADLDKMGLLKGVGLLALAEGINVLAKAASKFAALDISSMIKGLAGIGIVLLEIAAFMKLTSNSKGLISTAFGMTILGTAMLIFGKAVSNIGNLSWEAIAKGLVGIAASLLAVVAAMRLMPSGAHILAASAGMILLGTSMKIFGSAISGLSGMSWTELAKGLTAMALTLAEIVIAMKLMGAKALAGAAATLICAAALGAFVPVLKILGGMSLASIGKALLTIAGVFVILGASAYVLAPLVPTMLGLAGAMALLGVAAAAFGAGLLAVSVALSAFAGSAVVLVTAIVDIIIGLVRAIPDILKALAESLGEALASIIEVVVTIGKALLQAINDLVPMLIEVVLNVVQELLGALAGHIGQIVESLLDIIVRVLDGLTAGIPKVITSAVKLFQAILNSIFEALGGLDIGRILTAAAALTAFAGLMALFAVVAAEAVVATAALPIIGLNLNTFIQNAEPFLEKIQNVDSASLRGAKYLAETVLMLTAAGIMDALTSWFTGGQSFIRFGKQLSEFAPYLNQYYQGIRGIDADMVENSAVAAKSLAQLADNLPSSGGLASLFAGSKSLTAFAQELTNFGPAMKSYAKSVDGIDVTVVEGSARAAGAISEMAKKLPKHGGLKKIFAGDSTLSDFAKELSDFGPSFKSYTENMEGLDTRVVVNSANAASAISEMAEKLPKHGGLKSVFSGDSTLSDFAAELSDFGPAMKSYADSVSGIGTGSIVASANAASALVEIANALPNLGGLSSWIEGEQDLGDFGRQLASYGTSLAAYADSVSGITVDDVSGSVEATSALVGIADAVPKLGGLGEWLSGSKDFKSFGNSLKSYGESLKEYIGSVKEIVPQDVEGSVEVTSALTEVANALPLIGGISSFFKSSKNIKTFGNQLKGYGKGLVNYVGSVKDLDADKVAKVKMSAEASLAMAKVLNEDIPEMGGFVSLFTGGKNFAEFGSQLNLFGDGLNGYVEKVGDMDAEKVSVVRMSAQAASVMAKVFDQTPELGGFFSLFTGGKDFVKFGTQLGSFGDGLKNYITDIQNINEEQVAKVKMSAEAASAMAKVLNEDIPEMGGFFGLFTGKKDFARFGETLPSFGESLQKYSASVSKEGFNAENVRISAEAAAALAKTLGDTPEIGGLISLFTGDTTWDSFSSGLEKFGTSLTNYSAQVSKPEFNAEKVIASADAALTLANVLKNMPDIGGIIAIFEGDQTWDKFGSGLSAFGVSIAGFASSVGSVEEGKLESALTATERLLALSRGIVDIDSGDIKKFGKSFKSLANDGISEFVTAMADPEERVKGAGQDMINRFLSAINAQMPDICGSADSIINLFCAQITLGADDIRKSANYLMNELDFGVSSYSDVLTDTINGILDEMYEAVTDAKIDFYNAGVSLSNGFSNGIAQNGRIADSAANGLNTSVAAISRMLDENLDCQPVIRPVIDLSGVYEGVGRMDGLFSSGRFIDLADDTGYGMNGYGMAKIQNGIAVNQNEVVGAIADLRSDVRTLASQVAKLQVVLDTGELVGGLSGPMDSALGKIMLRKERRN